MEVTPDALGGQNSPNEDGTDSRKNWMTPRLRTLRVLEKTGGNPMIDNFPPPEHPDYILLS